ncbi:hypothetical protein [Prevotella nigrescens]|uniref:hypothetical protein n=1 Tax=Prevotella nigrescens TaxID=28133 RepID=UPI00242EB954|nr:hypothetical protein [Prevotella nigrescens]
MRERTFGCVPSWNATCCCTTSSAFCTPCAWTSSGGGCGRCSGLACSGGWQVGRKRWSVKSRRAVLVQQNKAFWKAKEPVLGGKTACFAICNFT